MDDSDEFFDAVEEMSPPGTIPRAEQSTATAPTSDSLTPSADKLPQPQQQPPHSPPAVKPIVVDALNEKEQRLGTPPSSQTDSYPSSAPASPTVALSSYQAQSPSPARGQQDGEDDELAEIFVKNLDSGETVAANKLYEEYLSRGGAINPLAFQIYKRTGHVVDSSASHLNRSGSDESADESSKEDGSISKGKSGSTVRQSRTKSFFRNMRQKVSSTLLGGDSGQAEEPDADLPSSDYIKLKGNKNRMFTRLVLVQEFMSTSTRNAAASKDPEGRATPLLEGVASSAIWVMKFNRTGRYLAAGGQDSVIRIWTLMCEPDEDGALPVDETAQPSGIQSRIPPLFKSKPFREFRGHRADVLDLSWSKNDFLLSSSMDRTVRLWHVTRKECLCCFQHADFVTSITFHPKDDRFFLSGCLDCRIRMWNIPEKKVSFWNELPDKNMITAVGFTASGKTAIAGSYIGTCVFYETDGLKYNTQIHVRSSRGKNSKGEKITSIEAMPGLPAGEEKILIASNDSRLRIYNMRDKSLFCKFKGLSNESSQIRAHFSDDGKFIISGSEDHCAYIWKLGGSSHVTPPALHSASSDQPGNNLLRQDHKQSITQVAAGQSPALMKSPSSTFNFHSLTSTRRDRNFAYEAFQAHENICTCAMFAPSETATQMEASGLRYPPIPADSLKSNVENSPLSTDENSRTRARSQEPEQTTARASPAAATSLLSAAADFSNRRRTVSANPVAQLDTLNLPPSAEPISTTSSTGPNYVPRSSDGKIIVTADYRGIIRVFENERPDRSYYNNSNNNSSSPAQVMHSSHSSLNRAGSVSSVEQAPAHSADTTATSTNTNNITVAISGVFSTK